MPDCSLHCTSALQDLQVLAGAQQCSAVLELWQIAPYTAHLPSRTYRSWQELNSAQHRWSCGRLFLTPQICHPRPAGSGWQELSGAGPLADCSLHRTSAIQDLQILAGAQQRRSCGRLLLTPQICHPGPAGPDRSSEMLGGARAVAKSSPHHKSAIQDLQVLDGAQQHSRMLELWQILPPTAHLPCRTCRSWQELSSAGFSQIICGTANLPSKTCRS